CRLGHFPSHKLLIRLDFNLHTLQITASSCSSFVPVMQSADFGDLDYNSRLGRLYCSRLRRILGKREMSPRAMIICEVTFQDAAQVPFPKDDDVIRALSTNRSDESFDRRTLPWAMGSRHHFLIFIPCTRRRNSSP